MASRGKNLKKIKDIRFQNIHRLKNDSDLQWHSKKSYSHFIEILQPKWHFYYLHEGYPLTLKSNLFERYKSTGCFVQLNESCLISFYIEINSNFRVKSQPSILLRIQLLRNISLIKIFEKVGWVFSQIFEFDAANIRCYHDNLP